MFLNNLPHSGVPNLISCFMQILNFQVVYIDTSTVKLTLSVVKVEEFDFSIKLDHIII